MCNHILSSPLSISLSLSSCSCPSFLKRKCQECLITSEHLHHSLIRGNETHAHLHMLSFIYHEMFFFFRPWINKSYHSFSCRIWRMQGLYWMQNRFSFILYLYFFLPTLQAWMLLVFNRVSFLCNVARIVWKDIIRKNTHVPDSMSQQTLWSRPSRLLQGCQMAKLQEKSYKASLMMKHSVPDTK